MNYVDLPHNKKLNLLNEHDGDWENLEQSKWCLHCSQSFTGLATRVWKDDDGRLWLECGTPGCDGSPIDWAPYPWWDDTHPATIEYLKKNPRTENGPGFLDDEFDEDEGEDGKRG
ncbi:hypothetical protein DES53_103286 [Roseimicrobium gellanilyticum]|uniref:Uncharacterized protein n=1 Tax=Roseimicrobium gellanilyticum TaxID=748857 RepID=A0A366HR52_9BACT|nr:hypothetical protein [Roseimicrobium gellanilyticum]RBP45288.1 hypothetical protein DES53_103286 [Roseimicrobium gellanilyticum]